MRKTVIATLILAALPAASLAMDEITGKQPDALKWGAPPPMLPPGSELAVVAGDPTKNEAYVMRLRTPANYMLPAHTHPADSNITVLSGAYHIGKGAKLDPSKGETLGPGAFINMTKGIQHYAWTPTPTVVQFHGMGPFEINYVNPADDPRKAATTGSK